MRAEQLANVWHLRGSRTSRTSRYYAWTWAQDKLGGGQKARRAGSARDHLMESCELWEAALKKCVEYHTLFAPSSTPAI